MIHLLNIISAGASGASYSPFARQSRNLLLNSGSEIEDMNCLNSHALTIHNSSNSPTSYISTPAVGLLTDGGSTIEDINCHFSHSKLIHDASA